MVAMAIRMVRFALFVTEKYKENNCTQVLNGIQEVDLIATQLTTTYARSKVIDFTTSFSKDPMSAVIPAPKEDNFMSAIVKPFQPGVKIFHFKDSIN